AAQVMASAIAPLMQAQTRTPVGSPQVTAPVMSATLRSMLTTMLERSAQPAHGELATRSSQYAPAMVTPPAPREEETSAASDLADRYAEQRARIVELQRVARVTAEREAVARTAPAGEQAARIAEIQQRATEAAARREEATRQLDTRRATTQAERVAAAETERARLEERIAQRLADRARQQDTQRLHETAREAAARDARIAPAVPQAETRADIAPPSVQSRIAAELANAVSALPPELASMVASSISQRPDRAAQAIADLGEALRTVELLARTTASGGSIAPSRGPRLVMPAGLGGLVSTVEHTTQPIGAAGRVPQFAPTAGAPMFAAPVRDARVPAMTWLAPMQTRATATPAPTSALGAAMQSSPAALHHVAWSDRWLARFAGAQAQSLDVFSTASGESRLAMLAAAAPGAVFVAPSADEPQVAAPSRTDIAAARSSEVRRYDDDAETPDDVLFAIAAAARSSRPSARKSDAAPATPAAPAYDPMVAPTRETLADVVAHAAPGAPGAGLSAQLASSPFAPALRHVLPIGSAPSFDVRALFGSAVGATYLAGLLSSATDELVVPRSLPTWALAALGETPMGAMPAIGERAVESFEPTYVAPADVANLEGEGVAQAAAAAAPLTTLRSALLSFDVETFAATATAPTLASRITAESTSPSLARALVDTLSLPMLADSAAMRDPGTLDVAGGTAHVPSYGAPGMVADRAHAWSVAQERSSADLAYDFVTPELVLAARVYGLGPAEAAQAARLAIAGPGALSAMAGAVDRTFVQAMAIEAERRHGRTQIATAYPLIATADGTQAFDSPSARDAAFARDVAQGVPSAAAPPLFAPSASSFGVEKRAPRGAYLWPAATTAALGLTASMPDGEQSMSVAALELLAAQAVAELGTYSALGEISDVERRAVASVASRAESGATITTPGSHAEPSDDDILSSAAAFVPAGRRDKFQALYLALSQSPSGRTASPAARAARALALAGRGDEAITARERANVAWDVLPVVFGQRDREPAAGEERTGATVSTGEQASRMLRRREEVRAMDPTYVERPGLGPLSARAGEALGSYVAPAQTAPAAHHRDRDAGAVLRAPSAAHELVQTGRPAGRFGGGEVEIPTWFEQAARKMLADRSAAASTDFSLAELTLVTSAPAPQLAASSRAPGGSSPSRAPAPAADGAAGGEKKGAEDIEKIANEVYREVLVLMDIARARNGEPYL
ncbi:MAG TPA: MAP7 domain-containing protein, partial [Kofleriaceae bacterium]|nr:MAP7 domain-containing protein [Kofleriaceae bacterium]